MYESLPWYRFPRYSEELEKSLLRESRDKIKKIQSEKLRQVVKYAWGNVPFYRWLWSEAGVSPEHIKTIDDIVKLPTWNKKIQKMAIEKNPPFGNFYTFEDVNDSNLIVSTSGTTGLPVMMPLKNDDIPGLKDTTTRCFEYIGINERDIVQVLFTYSTMGAAWASTWAAEGVGATVLPASSGKTTPSIKQVSWIKQAGVTVLIGTGSYIKHLANVAQKEGIDPSSSSVRFIVTAGEMLSKSTRQEIERLWGAKLYDVYGTVDTMSWSSIDCDYSRETFGASGMHIWEDAAYIEVLDEHGSNCPNREYGNMTITTWSWKNSPRIRYSMGDAVAIDDTPCPCGMTTTRMLPIKGRVDDVIRIKGQNLYPIAIEDFVKSFNYDFDEYMVEVYSVDGIDKLDILLEFADQNKIIKDKVEQRFLSQFNVSATIKFVPIGSTSDFTGAGTEPKIKRVFDKRFVKEQIK